jgi:hypothetical protein
MVPPCGLDIVGVGGKIPKQPHGGPELGSGEQLGGKRLVDDVSQRGGIDENSVLLQLIPERLHPC